MFEIKQNTFYSRDDLSKILSDVRLDVDTFIARLKPRKVFRAGWLGSDLLDAFRKAPAIDERRDKLERPRPRNSGNRERRRSKATATGPLDRLMK